jgi:hypothetical protein
MAIVRRGRPEFRSHEQVLTDVEVLAEGDPPFHSRVPLEFESGWFRIQLALGDLTNEYAFEVKAIGPFLWRLVSPLVALVSMLLHRRIPITAREIRVRPKVGRDVVAVEPRWPNDVRIEITFANSLDLQRFWQTVFSTGHGAECDRPGGAANGGAPCL